MLSLSLQNGSHRPGNMVSKVVFNMIALIFKCVKSFVLKFPACATTFNQLGHIIFIDDNISHPTVAVDDFDMDLSLR